jgi:hypothetical protein
MNYPFWDTGIGYGALMAAIAVVHVFVSHFAIGGGLYLVVAETSARKAGDDRRLEYLAGLSKFFVLVSLVFGALTGVGIWFIIGLLNPAATEVLIRLGLGHRVDFLRCGNRGCDRLFLRVEAYDGPQPPGGGMDLLRRGMDVACSD